MARRRNSPDGAQAVTDPGAARYFTQLPYLVDDSDLDPYAFRLYCHYKRRAGDHGVCHESVRTTAQHCRMSPAMVVKTRRDLAARGLVTIEEGTTPTRITIVDIWPSNMTRYAPAPAQAPPPPGAGGGIPACSPDEQPRSPHEQCSPGERLVHPMNGSFTTRTPSEVDPMKEIQEGDQEHPLPPQGGGHESDRPGNPEPKPNPRKASEPPETAQEASAPFVERLVAEFAGQPGCGDADEVRGYVRAIMRAGQASDARWRGMLAADIEEVIGHFARRGYPRPAVFRALVALAGATFARKNVHMKQAFMNWLEKDFRVQRGRRGAYAPSGASPGPERPARGGAVSAGETW